MSRFAPLPDPPYWAVIFTAQLGPDTGGYDEMAEEMVATARDRPGFLGIESTRDTAGLGITVSYWESEASIAAWKADARHALAQKLGRDRWYEQYTLRVARVERAYDGPEGRADPKAG